MIFFPAIRPIFLEFWGWTTQSSVLHSIAYHSWGPAVFLNPFSSLMLSYQGLITTRQDYGSNGSTASNHREATNVTWFFSQQLDCNIFGVLRVDHSVISTTFHCLSLMEPRDVSKPFFLPAVVITGIDHYTTRLWPVVAGPQINSFTLYAISQTA